MRKLVVSAMALVLVLFSTGVSLAQSCPSGVVPFYPANGATNVPRDPSDSVTVKWTAVPGATSYDVYFGPVGGG